MDMKYYNEMKDIISDRCDLGTKRISENYFHPLINDMWVITNVLIRIETNITTDEEIEITVLHRDYSQSMTHYMSWDDCNKKGFPKYLFQMGLVNDSIRDKRTLSDEQKERLRNRRKKKMEVR